MTDSDRPSLDGWHEATGAKKDAVIDKLLGLREQALSARSDTAALGYELDDDGEILWWVSPAFLLRKGPWAPKRTSRSPTRRRARKQLMAFTER
jgi:hypothetical protein